MEQELICQAVYPVVWDGRGFWRRHNTGIRLWVFRDVSPYPADEGEDRYGVCESPDDAGFDPRGTPWTTESLLDAIDHANGRTD